MQLPTEHCIKDNRARDNYKHEELFIGIVI
jgi:hypothetical protein